jgi:ABC-type polysaccharide/polyol phosphate transport system ATPase subunit
MPAAVTLEDVSKRYRIYHQRHDSFKESFLRRRRGVHEDFWALRNVSFEIDDGTTVGIIGSNGSGKSTTLKLIAHILHPDGGHLEVNGRVSALLELGTGFHHDYTGRENIFLNGALLGIRRATIRERLEEIIAFSELANFIDNPVKTYSSGQYMRLAFSIAVNVDPDVLLIDEVLAVGDAAFAQKCFDRISRFRTEEKTIVLVSHDLKAVEKFCDRALWIDQGHIRADGVPSQVTRAYLEAVQVREQEALADAPQPGRDPRRWGTRQAEIARVEVLDRSGRPQYVFDSGEPLQVRITYRCPDPVADPVFGIGIFRSDGVHVYGTNTRAAHIKIPQIAGSGSIVFRIDELNLLEGGYALSVAITDREDRVTYDHWDRRIELHVRQDHLADSGLVRMPSEWSITPSPVLPLPPPQGEGRGGGGPEQ